MGRSPTRHTAVLTPEHVARDQEVRAAPQEHEPKLVLSQHHRGPSLLERIAENVNLFVGSMWTFVAVTSLIALWLVVGHFGGFDRAPWPLLLTLLNLPQLSIMISLQVSANLSQKTSDARAISDHETLIALHELSKQQIQILEAQNAVLDLLKSRLDGAGQVPGPADATG